MVPAWAAVDGGAREGRQVVFWWQPIGSLPCPYSARTRDQSLSGPAPRSVNHLYINMAARPAGGAGDGSRPTTASEGKGGPETSKTGEDGDEEEEAEPKPHRIKLASLHEFIRSLPKVDTWNIRGIPKEGLVRGPGQATLPHLLNRFDCHCQAPACWAALRSSRPTPPPPVTEYFASHVPMGWRKAGGMLRPALHRRSLTCRAKAAHTCCGCALPCLAAPLHSWLPLFRVAPSSVLQVDSIGSTFEFASNKQMCAPQVVMSFVGQSHGVADFEDGIMDDVFKRYFTHLIDLYL